MFNAVFLSLRFWDLLRVGFVAGGIFAKEDLTSALMDAAGRGWVGRVKEGESGRVLDLERFFGSSIGGRGNDKWIGLTVGCFFIGVAVGFVVG